MKTEGEDHASTRCRLQSSDTTPEETRCTATDNNRNGETPIGPSVSGPVVSVGLVNHSSDDCQMLQGTYHEGKLETSQHKEYVIQKHHHVYQIARVAFILHGLLDRICRYSPIHNNCAILKLYFVLI